MTITTPHGVCTITGFPREEIELIAADTVPPTAILHDPALAQMLADHAECLAQFDFALTSGQASQIAIYETDRRYYLVLADKSVQYYDSFVFATKAYACEVRVVLDTLCPHEKQI